MRLLHDLQLAVSLLTRLPSGPYLGEHPRAAAAVWAYPLVGLLVGGIGGAVLAGSVALGLPALASAILALIAMTAVSGGLHEDGLADCADALGGRDRETRLAIMKDSRIGSFGTIALILTLGLRAATLAALAGAAPFLAPIVAASLSRAAMTLPMAALPHARETGLAVAVGRPTQAEMAVSLAIALLVAVYFTGLGAAVLAAIAIGIGVLVAAWARAKLGGQTGDVLGATQQVTECAALLALTILVL